MLSAWWLFLIVPVSACLGYITCGLMLMGKFADESDIDDSTENGYNALVVWMRLMGFQSGVCQTSGST